jgi:hypothetical protein
MRSSRYPLSQNRSSIHAQEMHLHKRPLPLIYTLQVASLEASSRSLNPLLGHLTYFPHFMVNRFIYLESSPLLYHLNIPP